MSIAFGRQGKCAGGGRARAGGETRAGGEKKRVAFSRRPVAQWD